MAVIKSGATTDQLTIDPTSKAARVTLYDSAGSILCRQQTYNAGVTATASAAGTGVLANIVGSATKTVKVYRIRVNATVATTVIIGTMLLAKRTVAGSGGTPVALTVTPTDSSNTAATATANVYSALATAGTGGGVIDFQSKLIPLVSSTTFGMDCVYEFNCPAGIDGALQPWVLRGVAQSLELSMLATTTNTPTFAVSALWTEE